MPVNPYSEDELKRRAQVGMLQDAPPLGGQPVSTTMPIGGAKSVIPERSPGVGLVNSPAPSGWDAGNWADPNMHSVKYDAGRLLYGKNKPSDVGTTVRGEDFQKRFPGATFDGKDNIDFRGILSDGDKGSPVGLIDVLMGADHENDSSNGLWWGAPDAAANGASASGAAPQSTGLNPLGDSSTIAKIMAELSAASNDEQSPAEREALMAMLQGGGI